MLKDDFQPRPYFSDATRSHKRQRFPASLITPIVADSLENTGKRLARRGEFSTALRLSEGSGYDEVRDIRVGRP